MDLNKLKDFDIPSYQTDEAAGVDLSASIENSIKIRPWEREIIHVEFRLQCQRVWKLRFGQDLV